MECKIFDMAGNVSEWCTETIIPGLYGSCVSRGSYGGDNGYTSARGLGDNITTRAIGSGFRTVLYL